jgi:hypothetical protein
VTPPRTIVEQVMAWPVFANTVPRRAVFGALVVILGALTLWPQPYLARAQLLPNSTSGLLSSLLGGGGAGGGLLQSLLGGGNSADVDLALARSEQVLLGVAAELRARGWARRIPDTPEGVEKLHRAADIEVIRGGILQISVRNYDPRFAKDVVQAFVVVVERRVAALSTEQTSERRTAASTMMKDATGRLQQAQAAIDQFRIANHLAAPEFILGAAVSRLTGLQAALTAEQAALDDILRFATPESFEVQSERARIAAIQKEIAQAQTQPQTPLGGPNLQGLTPKITTYENLYRDVKFAEAEYDVFSRYLEALAAEAVSAPLGVDIIQTPFISPTRQYNLRPLGLLVLVLVIGVCAEFYVAKRPPGGQR